MQGLDTKELVTRIMLWKLPDNILSEKMKLAGMFEKGREALKLDLPYFFEFVDLESSDLTIDGEDFLAKHKEIVNLVYIELELEDNIKFFETKEDKDGNLVPIKFVAKKLGDYILDKFNLKTLKDSNEIYYYAKGLYRRNGLELLKKLCARLLQDKFKVGYMNETIEYIRASTYVDPSEANGEWINLENGLLNPITREFKAHTPEVFSVTRIPITYDPKAECPLWTTTLSDRVDDMTYKTVQEMFGYCFLPGQKYEKAFLFYGPKRTFKSTCLAVLAAIIGKENCTAYPLQQLSEDDFALAYLFGKAANICADIDAKALRDTGRFLTITGGDPLTAGKKNQHHITWYPDTKLIFSCNVIPSTTNKHPAFYRRWIILEFKKQTPEDQVDSTMKDKLMGELSGILNWALEGLKRLEEQGRFSYARSEAEVKDLYERNSDTIQSFIVNKIDTEDDYGALVKRDVYRAYQAYCDENNLQPENVIKFGRMFIALTGCATGKKGTDSNALPAYKGVNWLTKEDKKGGLEAHISEENTTFDTYMREEEEF